MPYGTIYDELVKDIFREETRAGYVDLIGKLCDRGAEGIILGCTEIPLLVREGDATDLDDGDPLPGGGGEDVGVAEGGGVKNN